MKQLGGWLIALALALVLAAGSNGQVSPAPTDVRAAIVLAQPYSVGVYAVGSRQRSASEPSPGGDGPTSGFELLSIDTTGSGIVWRADGLIVTTAHVVERAEQVIVRLHDDRILVAQVLGVDADLDVALLRIDARWDVPPPLGIGRFMRPGDWAIALGEPFQLQRSVTLGFIGGSARHFVEDREVAFLQLSMTLNPGGSGGPLLDASGTVVGMNARSIVGPHGMAAMSLALPMEQVDLIARGLLRGGDPG